MTNIAHKLLNSNASDDENETETSSLDGASSDLAERSESALLKKLDEISARLAAIESCVMQKQRARILARPSPTWTDDRPMDDPRGV